VDPALAASVGYTPRAVLQVVPAERGHCGTPGCTYDGAEALMIEGLSNNMCLISPDGLAVSLGWCPAHWRPIGGERTWLKALLEVKADAPATAGVTGCQG
jgi:hypothetical protein